MQKKANGLGTVSRIERTVKGRRCFLFLTNSGLKALWDIEAGKWVDASSVCRKRASMNTQERNSVAMTFGL